MWGAIFAIASYAIKALVALIDWGHERRLIESGRAQAQADAMRDQINDLQTAIAIREAVRRERIADPRSVSEHDEFERPE